MVQQCIMPYYIVSLAYSIIEQLNTKKQIQYKWIIVFVQNKQK